MSEKQKPTCESNIDYRLHADCYAGIASVEVDDEQKNLYSELRKMEFDPEYYSEYGPGLWSLSDQQLLYLTLKPEQQTAFENRYNHIDFGHALECYFQWCDYKYPEAKLITIAYNNTDAEMLSA